jgi:hypothetical protein
MDEQMAAWMKYASPSEEHEFLKKLSGTWNASVKMWMKPDDPPQESKGTAKNEMIFDGRYLVSKFDGDTPFGKFQGMAVDAYDRINEKYSGIWLDSMGTLIMVFEGQAEGNVRTMVSEFTNPMTGKPAKMKGVTTIVGEDEHRYESWTDGPDGKLYKNMEIVYKRQ